MLVGSVHALALLLGSAAVAKLVSPARTSGALSSAGLPSGAAVVRFLAVVELLLAVAVLAVGGPLPALGLAFAYLGFAGFVARLLGKAGDRAGCGCFGGAEAPAGRLHVVVNLVAAAVASAAAFTGARGLGAELARQPAYGVPYLGLVGLLAWLTMLSLTSLPSLGEAKRGRRGVTTGLTMAPTAGR
jgi:hypothetical protein